MEIDCDKLSAGLELIYSILASPKGWTGPDLPRLERKARMEENLYPVREAKNIKDKSGERESARYQASFSSSDQNYHLRWKCEF